MTFDTPIDRRGTNCSKWDAMEAIYGVSPGDGLAMWVADMDFRPPQVVQDRLAGMLEHGIYGYRGQDDDYRAAITWWMANRHGWQVDPAAIFAVHGLVNGMALCMDAFTAPGDGVILLTPMYHAFLRKIPAAGRRLVQFEMPCIEGRYALDIEAWEAQMTGDERMLVLCSPHNPGGRVWSRAELRQIADLCIRHDLILVSDEIHHDLVMPGQTHVPMALVEGIEDRLAMLTAPTKTFNIAGCHTGNVILPDPALRARFAARMDALGLTPNAFGIEMTIAAYSPQGAAWVDELTAYLEGNRRIFDAGINAIPGLRSMPLEATYLAWVDFAGTGMEMDEVHARVLGQARIAPNFGPTFGQGGATHLRFNIGAPRAVIQEAVRRLQAAFADLQ